MDKFSNFNKNFLLKWMYPKNLAIKQINKIKLVIL